MSMISQHSAKRSVYLMCDRFVRPLCRKWYCEDKFRGCKKSIKYQNNMMIIIFYWLGQIC